MTTYQWNVVKMDQLVNSNGQNNVVCNVYWKLNDPTIATPIPDLFAVHGSTQLNYSQGAPFIPYSSLTESQVIQWVQNQMGANLIAAMQAKLDNNIAKQTNPLVIQTGLPWINTSA